MKYLWISLLAIISFADLGRSGVALAAQSSDINYHQTDNTLSVELYNRPLVDVLKRISDVSGVPVLIEPGVKGTVSASFSHRKMADALDTLLRDSNYLILYDKVSGSGEDALYRVSELQVFASGNEDNELLVPISKLVAQDRRQQWKAKREVMHKAMREHKQSKHQLTRQISRLKRLREIKPERFEARRERLLKRYPEKAEWIDAKIAAE